MKILTKENLVAKIKAAEEKYNKESPCRHCGPGNGCDDCRGCEDAKKNYELEKIRNAAYDEYKQTFGHSYEQDCDYDLIIKYENELKQSNDKCNECHGNFGDDCVYCDDFDKKYKIKERLQWAVNEFKRKYNIEYIDFKKQINNLGIMDDNLKVNNGVSIKEWIENGINEYGAKQFHEDINNNWAFINNSIKNAILFEIDKKIKPEKIETIDDVAKLLDGNQYGDELRNESDINIEELCRKNKWVIVFGYSDDNVELRGAIDDELGAWNGTILKLVNKGDFYLEDCDEYGEDDATYRKATYSMFVDISENELNDIKETNYKNICIIEALWSPEDSDASWQFNCKGANYARFNIMEEEELYAECLVIDLNGLING